MSLFKKILAFITIFVLLLLFILTFYLGLTGNPNFFGVLALTIIIPVILWTLLVLFSRKK